MFYEAKIINRFKKQKNPAVSGGIFCKQFRRLMMNHHFFFVSSASICLSFLLPFIST